MGCHHLVWTRHKPPFRECRIGATSHLGDLLQGRNEVVIAHDSESVEHVDGLEVREREREREKESEIEGEWERIGPRRNEMGLRMKVEKIIR